MFPVDLVLGRLDQDLYVAPSLWKHASVCLDVAILCSSLLISCYLLFVFGFDLYPVLVLKFILYIPVCS